MAGGRGLRPRHRIYEPVLLALHHIVDAEGPPRLEHARHFFVETGAIPYVHGHVDGDGGIERAIRERHAERAGHPIRDAVGEPRAPGQFLGRGDIGWRQIDTRHSAPTGRRDIPTSPSEAATYVD